MTAATAARRFSSARKRVAAATVKFPRLGGQGVIVPGGFIITAAHVVGAPGTGWTVIGAADYDGDGRDDILLRDSGGDLAVWVMNGLTISSGAVIAVPGTAWIPIVP